MSAVEEALRDRLLPARPDPATPAGTQAAVVVPIIDGSDPSLIFTVRSQEVRDHKGEISFPGGVRHDEDPDLAATALRETDEELGIPPARLRLLGALRPTHTIVTGYVIVPYVALLPERPEMTPSAVEIAEVLELRLGDLAGAEREVASEGAAGTRRTWFAYTVGEHTVWGATGRIVHQLLETLRAGGWRP